jgi:hypothetical protein
VRDSQSEDGFGGNGTSEPEAFLGIKNWMSRDSIKIKAFASPGLQKAQIRLGPSGVHTKFNEIVLNLSSSKLSSSGFAAPVNESRVGSSSIAGSGMVADDKKSIRSKDSLFKDTEEELLLFG